MARARIGVLADDEDPHRVEGLGERPQDLLTRRQVSAAGRPLRTQEGSQRGHLRVTGASAAAHDGWTRSVSARAVGTSVNLASATSHRLRQCTDSTQTPRPWARRS